MSSIFISHNHKDKAFCRRLAHDLRKYNIRIWIDEAEIKIGDSLIEKIREGIDEMEYVGVVLSHNSINSSWVNKEVDIAMNQEIEGNRVKVLPILIDDVELPGFLMGKLYADFRREESYEAAFKKLLERLIVVDEQRSEEIKFSEKLKISKRPMEDILHTRNNAQIFLSDKPSRMMVSIRKREEFEIEFYQKYITDLYYSQNQRREIHELFSLLYQEVDNLIEILSSKSINKDITDAVYVKSFSWLFAISSRINISLQETFFQMYPGVCPYCIESKCVCYKTGKSPLRTIPVYRIKEEMFFKYEAIRTTKAKPTLDFAASNIKSIFTAYEAIVYNDGPKYLAARVQEKTADLRKALKKYLDKDQSINIIADRVSDLFAWIIFSFTIMYPNMSLDDHFVDYYIHDCPECNKAPCMCGLLDSQPAALIDFDKISLIKKNLDQLVLLLPDRQNEFSDLSKSYEFVLETNNMPMAFIALKQTKEILEKIQAVITTLDVDGKSASVLYSSLSTVVGMLKTKVTQNHDENKYDIFLSYYTGHRESVRTIIDFLMDNKINVFLSEKKIQQNSKWEEVIKDALRNSKVLCLYVSPENLGSEWLYTEVDSAWILNIPTILILYQCGTKDLPDKLQKYQSVEYHEYSKIIDVLERYS